MHLVEGGGGANSTWVLLLPLMQSVLDGRGKALAAAIHADTLSVILK